MYEPMEAALNQTTTLSYIGVSRSDGLYEPKEKTNQNSGVWEADFFIVKE